MAAAQSIWKMAFRNLSNQNTTTILTVAAIAVCVMTFVSIFSILDGLQLTIQSVIEGYYENRILVLRSAGSTDFHGSSIPEEVADEYRDLPGIAVVSEEALLWANYEGTEIEIIGVDLEDFERIYLFEELEGRRPSGPQECLVGRTLATSLGIEEGMDLRLLVDGRSLFFNVAGIFVTKTNNSLGLFQTNTPMDTQLLVSRPYLSSVFPRFASNTSIVRIRAGESEGLALVEAYTAENHPELVIMEAMQVSNFFEKSIINVSRLLSTIVVFVIILMVLGIYNSMNMVVSERTWEIGVIRAIGARKSFVLRLFVAESAMLALLGGLFGVALGIAMSHAITSFFSIFVEGSTSIAPLTKLATIGWGIAASLIIGLFGGIFPANRASTLLISEALAER
jgi:putative ABC transport system permease protein